MKFSLITGVIFFFFVDLTNGRKNIFCITNDSSRPFILIVQKYEGLAVTKQLRIYSPQETENDFKSLTGVIDLCVK